MGAFLRPIGQNGVCSQQQLSSLLATTVAALPAYWQPEHYATIADLLSSAILLDVPLDAVLAVTEQPMPAGQVPSAATLQFRIVGALAAVGRSDEARAVLKRAEASSVAMDDWSAIARRQGARARALHALGDAAGVADAVAAAQEAVRRGGEPADLAADLLSMGDFVSALGIVQSTKRIAPERLEPLYRDIIWQAQGAGRLALGLEVMHLSDDLLMQHRILHALMLDAIVARDGTSALMAVHAAPVAYQGDLLAVAVPRLVSQNMHRTALEAVQLWGAQEATSLLRLGAVALVSDPQPAIEEMLAALEQRLEQEEELGMVDAWAYRELGQALGWTGELGASLRALERVADHEDRLQALLGAAQHAPLAVQEALICAARGLVASLEEESRRVRALSRLGVILCELGRRSEGRAAFADALHIATSIRRPRTDQGLTRRSALLAVVDAQLSVGEFAAAYRAGRKLRTRRHQNPSLRSCAVAYAAAGDLRGACWCVEAMIPDASQLAALQDVVAVWVQAGRPLLEADVDAA